MTKPIVRLAREDDREAVLSFCQMLPGNKKDYIPLVWDKWIVEQKSQIFVATSDDIPVAMERVLFLSDSEAWREGLRVDSRYRNQGLSKILDLNINQYLLSKNLKVSRTMILSDNQIMANILSKKGYKKGEIMITMKPIRLLLIISG